ncbi:hypothetical protein KKI24_01380 [bacterium]|nr:hypothetical protein [bacterium]
MRQRLIFSLISVSFLLLLVLTLSGCKGTDGDDGKINITLSANSAFQNASYALGCFIVSNDQISCLCYEAGTGYTGTASGSTSCQGVASSVSLVALGTTISSIAAGDHNYCITTSASVDCLSGATGTATLTANSGSEGSISIPPKNGDDGDDKTYTITFDIAGATVTP